MSENKQYYSYRRRPHYRRRRQHNVGSRGGYRSNGGDNRQEKRDYSIFPKFKDSYSEKHPNSEALESSYDSKKSELNSFKHEDNIEKNRKRVPRGRNRRVINKKENVPDMQQSDIWDKTGQEKSPQNINKLSFSTNHHERFRSSSTDSDVGKLKTQVQILLNEKDNKNPQSELTAAIEDNNRRDTSPPSSSDTGSDSSSEKENPVSPKKLKKENASEDEVVCLGAIEQVENLVEKNSDSESCILCEKQGHESFYCFSVCKNCGGKYHILKNCPKPVNISTVLQRFMEFNLSQCWQYNPDQTFDFNSQVHVNNAGMQNDFKRYFENKSKERSSPVQSRSSRRRRSSSESERSSSEAKSKKRKCRKSKTDSNNHFNQFPFNFGLTPSLPFGTSGIPFGAHGVNINSMLALAQMMGQLPFNSSNNRL